MKVYCNNCRWFNKHKLDCLSPDNSKRINAWYKKGVAMRQAPYILNIYNGCPYYKPNFINWIKTIFREKQ